MKNIIMVGGRGTRISELFPDIPKPLIPIDGVPVLEREISSLASQGFTDIVLTGSYLHETLRSTLATAVSGMSILNALHHVFIELWAKNSGINRELQ